MGVYELLVLGGTYQMQPDDRVRVELFGRSKDGRSVTVRVKGFDPYFYIVEPKPSQLMELEEDSDVLGLEEKELLVDQVAKKCYRVTIKRPFDVPRYRKKYGTYAQILAADIPFVHRYYYDEDLTSCIRVEGEEVEDEGYTTDLVVDAKSVERAELFKPNVKIFSFDIENSMVDQTIFCIAISVRNVDTKLEEEVLAGDEKDILKEFVESVKRHDPDIITGYNIDGYDIPFIRDRGKKYGVRLTLGRNGNEISQVSNRFWRCSGRVIADAWWNVKREIRPKQETLDAVAKLLLGKQKLDVDRRSIDEEWARDKVKVMEYCKQDARLALEILENIRSVEKSQDLAAVSNLPLDDVLNGRTSTLIDSIFIREADRQGIGVPMTKHQTKTSKIIGGYVHEVEPGLYHWVCVLDFRSMYPSVIIENNICFTTLNEKGEIRSPTGARFLGKDKREGMLPQILQKIMTQRLELKKKMSEAKDEEQRQYYNGLQEAVKILMNSFYGVFASAFYRFTDTRIGESITTFSRENIKRIISELDGEGLNVIYSDTDSVFFISPHTNLEESVKFGEQVAEKYSKGAAVLEFEKIMEPFFTHGKKKRYVGKILWPKEEILVRGYETRRTDSFDLQTESLNTMFELILSDKIDEALKYAQDVVKMAIKGEVDIEKLVISKTFQGMGHYSTENIKGKRLDPNRLPYVQTAKKLEARGEEVTPGMKVSWIVTDGKKSPQDVEPYLPSDKDKLKPDYDYYARRIAATVSRITDVFGYDEKRLITGSMQSSLFADDFSVGDDDREKPGASEMHRSSEDESSEKKKKKKVVEEDKSEPVKKDEVSLDDFL
jgi:DNA polymerase I